jgi:uncharacterized membrane protein YgcG
MNDMYDVLETCLQEIENGADVDTVLFRYPEHAEELRPILEASVLAKSLASPEPSVDVTRRGRARILHRAAQMREAKASPSRRLWSVPLRRAFVSLAMIAVLFISSTGLVHASSTTLPGDNLYPVKRTWEDVRVLFAFNTQVRTALEVEHENERLNELNELFAEGRSEKVDFAGTLMSQSGNVWLVSNVSVQISSQTDLGGQPMTTGSAIRVRGFTQADDTVLAERVELLPAGIPLPDLNEEREDEFPNIEQPISGTQNESGDDHSGTEAEDEAPIAKATQTVEKSPTFGATSLEGQVDSITGNMLVIDGQSMNIAGAEIRGTPQAGAAAKVEGYYDASGVYIVTKIEFQSTNLEGGKNSSDSESKDNSGSSNDSGSDDHDGSGSNDSGGSNSGSGEGSDG